MADRLSGPNIEEEYLWSCTLTGAAGEYTWNPEDPADNSEDPEDEEFDPSCKPNHRLLVKTILLDETAKKDEVTVVQIETTGYKDQKVITPFAKMKSGVDLQRYLDILVPDAAKFKIISGTGPVTLVGSHCVDFYDYRNYGGDDEEDEDEESAENSEDDEEDMEEQEVKASPGKIDGKKAKGKKISPKKKGDEEKEEKPNEPTKEKGKKGTPKKESPMKKETSEPKKRKASDEDSTEKKKSKA